MPDNVLAEPGPQHDRAPARTGAAQLPDLDVAQTVLSNLLTNYRSPLEALARDTQREVLEVLRDVLAVCRRHAEVRWGAVGPVMAQTLENEHQAFSNLACYDERLARSLRR